MGVPCGVEDVGMPDVDNSFKLQIQLSVDDARWAARVTTPCLPVCPASPPAPPPRLLPPSPFHPCLSACPATPHLALPPIPALHCAQEARPWAGLPPHQPATAPSSGPPPMPPPRPPHGPFPQPPATSPLRPHPPAPTPHRPAPTAPRHPLRPTPARSARFGLRLPQPPLPRPRQPPGRGGAKEAAVSRPDAHAASRPRAHRHEEAARLRRTRRAGRGGVQHDHRPPPRRECDQLALLQRAGLAGRPDREVSHALAAHPRPTPRPLCRHRVHTSLSNFPPESSRHAGSSALGPAVAGTLPKHWTKTSVPPSSPTAWARAQSARFARRRTPRLPPVPLPLGAVPAHP